MHIKDESVISELKKIKEIISDAYQISSNSNCDRRLSNAIGRLDSLLNIIESN